MAVVREVMKAAERSDLKRITQAFQYDADEQHILNRFEKVLQEDLKTAEEEILNEEMELAKEKDKGKGAIIDTTPIHSPEHVEFIPEEIIGTSSGGEVLKMQAAIEEAKTRQELQDVRLDSLAEGQHALREDQQALRQTISEIAARQETITQNQKVMDSKLDAILNLLSKKP
jgi:hypothetical protein